MYVPAPQTGANPNIGKLLVRKSAGNLVSQDFDEKRMAVIGEAVPVAEKRLATWQLMVSIRRPRTAYWPIALGVKRQRKSPGATVRETISEQSESQTWCSELHLS